MTTETLLPVYELSLNIRVGWQAHSLSNAGSNGSNRVMPRRQMLADGTETDACSGDILKHHHSVLLAELDEYLGVPLCPACASRDGRRAAALVGRPEYKDREIGAILRDCGLCDAHGFLVTAKHAAQGANSEERKRSNKHTLIDYAYALAVPGHQAETLQLTTRVGDSKEDGQMIMKKSARSGEYAMCIRYRAVGIGVDTDKWVVAVDDQSQRILRHHAILCALRDQILSPEGALTATMLPHLTGVMGMVMILTAPGRVPIYSPLVDDFVPRLQRLGGETRLARPFSTVDEFYTIMNELIEGSYPYLPRTAFRAGIGSLQADRQAREDQVNDGP